ncbi:hypothetical protein M752DRAFT_165860 [Aspergillus phoenicis ATCC 13157]|uniref:Uncharacterized protein n=1 Tax=Aspergillus phoenicis ATCC 13157 TaxID=1353007 RepID=A0A370PLD7_ASPPH|nr:hypothetical protein M752DRAFT_165860 [Aspergillus phoenicis ATCC 13157]
MSFSPLMHNIPIGIYSRASPEAFRIVVILHPLGLILFIPSADNFNMHYPVQPDNSAPLCHRLAMHIATVCSLSPSFPLMSSQCPFQE